MWRFVVRGRGSEKVKEVRVDGKRWYTTADEALEAGERVRQSVERRTGVRCGVYAEYHAGARTFSPAYPQKKAGEGGEDDGE